MGFVPGRSIVTNAAQHQGACYVYNLDFKDFFHAFDRNRVKLAFMRAPFDLRDEREPLAFLLACLVTHPLELNGKTRTVLPQGSPTSPTLTNLLCVDLDRRLTGLAKRFGFTYTRYADDVTFSANHNPFGKSAFLDELKRIVEVDQGLRIHPNKTRLQKTGYRQEVTGLIVNDKVNVRRRYVKTLRNWLYLWERYGEARAEKHFYQDYLGDKQHVMISLPPMRLVIGGKLDFLRMVKGDTDPTYRKLAGRFERLTGEVQRVKELLKVWETKGIEAAMAHEQPTAVRHRYSNRTRRNNRQKGLEFFGPDAFGLDIPADKKSTVRKSGNHKGLKLSMKNRIPPAVRGKAASDPVEQTPGSANRSSRNHPVDPAE